MFVEILTLLKEIQTIDEYGDTMTEYEATQVFARKDKTYISQKIEAGAKGQDIQLKFTLADYLDYNGEKEAIWNGKKYQVMSGDSQSREIQLMLYGGIEIAQA
ncbi:MAG: head-tail adaptor protein [Clostridiaceae bacterium]|nr:head-tail adaptor protein [Clostridiaceae bacterium]